MWDIRAEPGVIDTFAKVWGTQELAVSFGEFHDERLSLQRLSIPPHSDSMGFTVLIAVDGVNVSLPFAQDSDIDRAPWPHIDQSPMRTGKYCVQGIMNLVSIRTSCTSCKRNRYYFDTQVQYENGPRDGGLMVLDGSFALFTEFFKSHSDLTPPGGWTARSTFRYTEDHLRWFYDKGCQWVKVEAPPGSLILWDSRCTHYGAAAEGDRPRVATCEPNMFT